MIGKLLRHCPLDTTAGTAMMPGCGLVYFERRSPPAMSLDASDSSRFDGEERR